MTILLKFEIQDLGVILLKTTQEVFLLQVPLCYLVIEVVYSTPSVVLLISFARIRYCGLSQQSAGAVAAYHHNMSHVKYSFIYWTNGFKVSLCNSSYM